MKVTRAQAIAAWRRMSVGNFPERDNTVIPQQERSGATEWAIVLGAIAALGLLSGLVEWICR